MAGVTEPMGVAGDGARAGDQKIEPAAAFARAFWAISLVEGLSFLFMAALHVGARVPLGFTVVTDVPIIQATVAESICGAALLLAASALLARRRWAWALAAVSQAVSIAAVLNGMGRVGAGKGPHSQLNDTYHVVIVVLLALGFIALILPPVQRAFAARAQGRLDRWRR
jgi:hypothetical protein